ncbi:MAG: DUF808 domain-containing protein [Planctomycetaceae bacterium]
MPSSLLLLIDDIAGVLDDVATMAKVAARKTAGVVGDDLALNAKQVSGVSPARELLVVWRVAVGSAINKLVLIPAALIVSGLAPWAVTPLLMAGGAYLCFEGAEKILHRSGRGTAAGHAQGHPASAPVDAEAAEAIRIAGAVRTDFILSAEIIVITLGVVAGRPLATQLGVMIVVAAAMTLGVYGLVATIVRLDDAGLAMAVRPEPLASIGRVIVAATPWLMRGLSIAGTAAMFLVGGGILAHGIPSLHHHLLDLAVRVVGDAARTAHWAGLLSMATDALAGLACGIVTVAAVSLARLMLGPRGPAHP